jgi:hypothetical protein
VESIGLGGSESEFAEEMDVDPDLAGLLAADIGRMVLPVSLDGRWMLGEAEIARATGTRPP